LAGWLAGLNLGTEAYQYRFQVREAPGDHPTFGLSVEVRPRTAEVSTVWVALDQAASRSDAVEALGLAALLADFVPELAELRTHRTVELPEARLTSFLAEAAPVLSRLGVEVVLPKALSKLLSPRLTVAVRSRGEGIPGGFLGVEDLVDYDWTVTVGGQAFTRKEFEALVRKSRGMVRFKDGYVTVDPEQLRRLLEPTVRAPGFREALADFLDGAPGFDPAARATFEGLFRQKSMSQPQGLVATLRPYQAVGFSWVWNNLVNGFGCLLADDMGLGKTLQAIGVLVLWKEEGRLSSPCLVVVPASLITNWLRELVRFAPALKVHTHHGTGRRLDPGADVVLTTYETVVRDVAGWAQTPFSLMILDEAHGLKNAAAKRSLAIRRVQRNAILALSGTPVENRLEDLRALFDLVMPGYLGEAGEFRTRWRIPIELHGNADVAGRLKRITAPFLLRRLKTDASIVPDLPEKTVLDEYATLAPPQAALYQAVLDELAGDPEAFDKSRGRQALVFQLLTALKQVCNHPRAYDGESPLTVEGSGKARLLLDLLETILENSEKVLVFSQYVGTLNILDQLIREHLDEAPLVLHGEMTTEARSRAVDAFQTDPARKIFLISLKAGGVGLNLTAASRVIHYDLWYNPAVENQATDRAFRIGQTRQVFVHRLICAGTFEEKIDAMLKAKKAMADLSVGTGESWLGDLGAAELRELFSGGLPPPR
jgi:SNF2 family DNA or RNA helicase